jgi:hypothetical protein
VEDSFCLLVCVSPHSHGPAKMSAWTRDITPINQPPPPPATLGLAGPHWSRLQLRRRTAGQASPLRPTRSRKNLQNTVACTGIHQAKPISCTRCQLWAGDRRRQKGSNFGISTALACAGASPCTHARTYAAHIHTCAGRYDAACEVAMMPSLPSNRSLPAAYTVPLSLVSPPLPVPSDAHRVPIAL